MDTRALTVLSICSGGGGLDLGLRLAVPNARTICYVENEAFACEVLASRMEDKVLGDAPIWTNLRTFDGKPWRGIVDCIMGGIPCQPHSLCGTRKGKQDARNLWPDTARIIREIGPSFVFVENVANIVRTIYSDIRDDLRRMGYQVEQGVFSAAEVGAPHLRRRFFILAYSAAQDGAMAVATRGGQRILRESPGGERQPNGNYKDMGHDSLANAVCQRVGGGNERGPGSAWKETDKQAYGTRSADEPGNRGKDVAYAEDVRGKRILWDEQDGLLSPMDARTSIFPPGPGDKESWRRVIESYPELEPAVRVMADGVAFGVEQSVIKDRVDQLRLMGNGVVPSCAAFAFAILLRRIVESDA